MPAAAGVGAVICPSTGCCAGVATLGLAIPAAGAPGGDMPGEVMLLEAGGGVVCAEAPCATSPAIAVAARAPFTMLFIEAILVQS